jgi:GTP-binding protein EngB required for normal cell division
LGIGTKNNEEIDEKEINNIIIFNVPFNDAENLLNSFIKEFNGVIQNDQYPFFVFFTNENNSNFDIKKIISDLNTFQLDIINDAKLDSRNIYFDTKETILQTITKIYNYYNGDFITELDNGENDNYNYDLSKTLNILVIGKRGHGKSSLINRILGEKRAYAHPNANTPNTKIYYHKYYPIKFIDSAGFETGEISNINNIKDYLEKKNLVYKDIDKKIHFIFYVFRENDKFEDAIVKILQELQNYKVEIFFIITNSTQGREIITKDYFEETIKSKKIFPKDKINGIINNTFCLD